jgi:hypothetical protein
MDIRELTDKELIEDADYWLNHPKIQWLPNHKVISFMTSVIWQWKQNGKISQKQRAWVQYSLLKHKR